METIQRRKRSADLTQAQLALKVQKDKEYEELRQLITENFKVKERSVGVTPQEEAEYRSTKDQQWADYQAWALAEGIDEEVSPQEQLTEIETELNRVLADVNVIRKELGQMEYELKEKGTAVIR